MATEELVEGRQVVRLKSGRVVWRDEQRDAWGAWVETLGPWQVFGALTFDPAKFATHKWHQKDGTVLEVPRRAGWRMPGSMALRCFQGWTDRVRNALGAQLDYVAAVEYHENKWPHLHVLIKLRDYEQLPDGAIALMGRLWRERYGIEDLATPRAPADACSYAAKYLCKDLAVGDVILSPGLRVG